MTSPRNLRKAERETLDHPHPAVIMFKQGDIESYRFVNICNMSVQGVLIDCDIYLEKGTALTLLFYNQDIRQWDRFAASIVWVHPESSNSSMHAGLEFLPSNSTETSLNETDQITVKDLYFLLNTKFITAVPIQYQAPLLNCFKKRQFPAKAVIKGDTKGQFFLCLIQEGSCKVLLTSANMEDKTGQQRQCGDMLGITTFLKADSSPAMQAIALTPMTVWQIDADKYQLMGRDYSELLAFSSYLLIGGIELSHKSPLRQIGKYTISHFIGAGPNGFVYKAYHQDTKQPPAAIKFLQHSTAALQSGRTDFYSGKDKIKALSHPHIEAFNTIETIYRTTGLTMNCLDGEPLEEILARCPRLPFERSIKYLIQTARAMTHAHDKGVIHANLKPANIFITREDQVRVTDFRLTGFLPSSDAVTDEFVYYMPPEMAAGNAAVSQSDIYSIGIMAFEFFTGQQPFTGSSDQQIMAMHQAAAFPDPRDVMPDLPAPIRDIILNACKKAPEDRYQAMADFLSALEGAGATLDYIL